MSDSNGRNFGAEAAVLKAQGDELKNILARIAEQKNSLSEEKAPTEKARPSQEQPPASPAAAPTQDASRPRETATNGASPSAGEQEHNERTVPPPRPQPSQAEILRAIKALFKPEEIRELRILRNRGGTLTGYYEDHAKLTEDAASYSSQPDVQGVYWTINPVNPNLLNRSKNHVSNLPNAARDEDILARTDFFLDIDPERPSNTSATNEENALTEAVAHQVSDYLVSRGWPEPLSANSGNGQHLHNAINLPNNNSTRDLLKNCLAALAARFDTPKVKIDTQVFNASRIGRVYGTVTAKGVSTAERPHRLAKLVRVPETLLTVSREQLEKLASEIPEQPAKAPNGVAPKSTAELEGRAQWIEQFLATAGISHCGRQEYEGGHRWQPHQCWFDPRHKATSAIVTVSASGAFGYHCSHDSCQEQGNKWDKFRAEVEKKLGLSFFAFALYRLDEVLEADSVFICWSVADCDAAKKLKLKSAATCCMDGEWREEHFEILRRKQRIIVIAGADGQDRARTQKIAQSLRNYDKSLNVESLKIIELPKAGSLAEWAEGRSKSDLIGLCESTPEWRPAAPQAEIHSDGAHYPADRVRAAERAIEELEKDKKSDPVPVLEAIAVVDEPVRRELLISRLGALKTGLTKELIQQQVRQKRARAEDERREAAARAQRSAVEARGQTIHGAELLSRFEEIFTRYIIAPKGVSLVAGLYALMSHCFVIFSWIAYLSFFSPLESCGKSHAADIVGWASARPEIIVDTSEAALFRLITQEKPTVVVDEAEVLSGDGETAIALRAVLHAGCAPDDWIIRCNPEPPHDVQRFSPWCPKVFCAIGKFPRVLASRCIVVGMKRKRAAEKVKGFIRDRVKAEVTKFGLEMAAWVAAHETEIRAVYESFPDETFGERGLENFAPLEAILTVADPQRIPEFREARSNLTNAGNAALENEIDYLLLSDIRAIFEDRGVDRISSAGLVEALAKIETSPWGEWWQGKPLSKSKLSGLLGKFGIKSDDIRLPDNKVLKGYRKEDFADAWSRYLDSEPPSVVSAPPGSPFSKRYNATNRSSVGDETIFRNATEAPCSVSKNTQIASTGEACSVVAFQNSDPRGADNGTEAPITPESPESKDVRPKVPWNLSPEQEKAAFERLRGAGGAKLTPATPVPPADSGIPPEAPESDDDSELI